MGNLRKFRRKHSFLHFLLKKNKTEEKRKSTMGASASTQQSPPYETVEAALMAGILQDEIDAWFALMVATNAP